MVSVLILTLNEEQNLPSCLESVKWCNDIVVLDSFSTDRTVEIAKAAGARVIQRKFDNWAAHQNWALENIRFNHPWVYYSDADEVVTKELRDELLKVAGNPDNPNVAYRLRYKNFFMGRWIRRCGIYPAWILRLFRPEKVRWERLVNPAPIVHGPEGRLQGHFEHYSFNKGLNAWFEKHNRYSWQEAEESLKSLAGTGINWRDLFASNPAARRRAMKELSFRLPCRPLLRFLYMYVWHRGFLDGRAGYTYCRLLTIYEYMIVLKMRELRLRERGATILKTPPSILFLNRVYPPGDGATGQLMAELAPELVRRGHRVTVVISESGTKSTSSETVAEVRVERVRGLPFTRASHWRRALSYLSLYPALLWRALRLPRADVVVTLTDPPLLLVLGVVLKALKGSRHVHWAQDIYPELAEEMDVLPKDGIVARALRRVSTAALRHADRVIAVGRCMKARLVQRGLAPSAIEVIPNWGHGPEDSATKDRATNSFRIEHGLGDRFVIMYSGNLGLAHPFEAMLDAAEQLKATHPQVLFLFVGNGPRLPWVREQAVRRKIDNIRFLPFQPRETLAQSLAAADLHLASMLHELCGLVVPSKVYGVISAGRPCVFLGPEASEAAQFILQHGCGSVLAKATGTRLASCLSQWAGDGKLLRETCGRVEAAGERVSLAAAVRAFSETLTKAGDSSSFQPRSKMKKNQPHLASHLGTSPTS